MYMYYTWSIQWTLMYYKMRQYPKANVSAGYYYPDPEGA